MPSTPLARLRGRALALAAAALAIGATIGATVVRFPHVDPTGERVRGNHGAGAQPAA